MLEVLIPGKVYVFKAPTNSGVVLGPALPTSEEVERPAMLIDSGLDDSQARKLYRVVEEELGGKVKAVFVTHAHADHFGGLFWLHKKGIQIMAPPLERAVIENPILKPFSLYGGAYPPTFMRSKFLYANPAIVDLVLDPGVHKYIGIEFEVMPLHGHSLGMVGVFIRAETTDSYPNGNEGKGNTQVVKRNESQTGNSDKEEKSEIDAVFIGDALFTQEVLEKHNHLPFNVHLEAVFNTLERLDAMADECHVKYFVPGHGNVLPGNDAFKKALQKYRTVLEENLDKVIEIIGSDPEAPCKKEGELVHEMMRFREADQLADKSLFMLIHSAVRANLCYLEDQGYIESSVVQGELCYHRL